MSPRFGSATDVGRRRSVNQDTLLADPALHLYVVADGMGGYDDGDIASRLIVDSMRQFVGETEVDAEKTWPFEFDLELSYQANRLKAAVLVANKRLSERLASSGSSRRMGATLAAALMGPDRAVVTNVGDCRVYLLRDGALRQLTQDHSWVAEQVASGFLSEQTARMHPWRHMVTRAIQGDPQMPVDTLEIDLAPGDRLLLCSDGLHVVVTDDHMRDLLLAGGPLDEVCRALIAAGNAGGGPDNLSVIVIEFPGDQGATTH